MTSFQLVAADHLTSSETQGQLVGAGKSLNGREKNSGEAQGTRTVNRDEFFSRLEGI